MQRSLEQRMAIKFCVKLEKSAAETISMLKKAFGIDCLSDRQIFRWHKAFAEVVDRLNFICGDPMKAVREVTLLSVNAGKHSPIPTADSDGLISHPRLQQKLGSGEGRKFILSQNLSNNMTYI
ncbi:hypothetical protein NQ318_009578 [Aromia moschata]|uniref:Mos1 transposase HTH domain-containing protein n=1 Tax=Aromia moschata TaxID=1265417 RepID=A0AAV8X615_9CUCU|nr:hypothetical protein NQ318_009578 [Aromia moschata]